MHILSVVKYGYRTWSVIHKAEHNAKLSENKVLQILDLEFKRQEVRDKIENLIMGG
jgi:hypothetical protein